MPVPYCYICNTQRGMEGNWYVCTKCKADEPRWEDIYESWQGMEVPVGRGLRIHADAPIPAIVLDRCPWLLPEHLRVAEGL